MSSETSKPPRYRHRFGFSGPAKLARKTEEISEDEILESLTRQASSKGQLSDRDKVAVEEMVQSGSYGIVTEPVGAHLASFETGREASKLGRFVFVGMLLGGIGVLWIYGVLSRTISPIILSRIQNFISITIFDDSTKVLVLVSFAIIVGLIARRARRRTDFHSLVYS